MELSSLIDIASIKKRYIRPEKPTVEDDIEKIPQRDIFPSNTYTAANEPKKLTSKEKSLSKKKKGFSSDCRDDKGIRSQYAKSVYKNKRGAAIATDIFIV